MQQAQIACIGTDRVHGRCMHGAWAAASQRGACMCMLMCPRAVLVLMAQGPRMVHGWHNLRQHSAPAPSSAALQQRLHMRNLERTVRKQQHQGAAHCTTWIPVGLISIPVNSTGILHPQSERGISNERLNILEQNRRPESASLIWRFCCGNTRRSGSGLAPTPAFQPK